MTVEAESGTLGNVRGGFPRDHERGEERGPEKGAVNIHKCPVKVGKWQMLAKVCKCEENLPMGQRSRRNNGQRYKEWAFATTGIG